LSKSFTVKIHNNIYALFSISLAFILNNIMDTMSNQERSQSGSGVGSGVSDDAKVRMPVGDVFDREKQQQDTNNIGQQALPYELSNIVDRLGDVFVSILSIKKIFKQVTNNPSINGSKLKTIEAINNSLDEANAIVANATAEIDNLQLNK
jgi:hypothetical protein